MKVLMLGWEFPPIHSGGLGVATKNIAMSLSKRGVPICFALPNFVYSKIKKAGATDHDFELAACDSEMSLELVRIKSMIASPYATAESYQETIAAHHGADREASLYGGNLYAEIDRYAHEMAKLAEKRPFSLVHGHDWITFPAAMKVKGKQKIPFVAHVHATEMDRTGGHPNQEIYDRERKGLESADGVITVSGYTKSILEKHYGIPADKIRVVHNGAEQIAARQAYSFNRFKEIKNVLFLGRLTLQKGPDWLIKIARRVLHKDRNVRFLLAGTGGMLPEILKEIAHAGLSQHIIPLGFIDEAAREEIFRQTDCYIMPSVSEPFGLSAIEAAQRGIPVIMSKQSGAREVLSNCLAADFWDVEKMAHYILAALHYSALHRQLAHKGADEVKRLTWDGQVAKMHDLYRELSPRVR